MLTSSLRFVRSVSLPDRTDAVRSAGSEEVLSWYVLGAFASLPGR